MCDLKNLDETVVGIKTSQEVTSCSIKALLDEKKKEACVDCHCVTAGRLWIREGSSMEDVEKEAE